MISKEIFVEAIEDVKRVEDYHAGLNRCLKKYGADGFLYQPDCTAEVLKLLAVEMNDDIKNGWIYYFCYELDFGKKWKAGCVIDKGKDIPLATAENLYDYLVKLTGTN